MEQHVRFQSLFSLIKMEMNKPSLDHAPKVQELVTSMRATLPEKKIQHSKKTKEMYANFRATLADDTSLWEHVMENMVEK